MGRVLMKIYENINVGLYEYVKQMNEKYKDFVAINYLGRKILFSEFMKNVEKVKEAFSKSPGKKGKGKTTITQFR